MGEELLAQLVEEVSVVASEMKRKKPREIGRPASIERARREAKGVVYGHKAMLAKVARMGGRVQSG